MVKVHDSVNVESMGEVEDSNTLTDSCGKQSPSKSDDACELRKSGATVDNSHTDDQSVNQSDSMVSVPSSCSSREVSPHHSSISDTSAKESPIPNESLEQDAKAGSPTETEVDPADNDHSPKEECRKQFSGTKVQLSPTEEEFIPRANLTIPTVSWTVEAPEDGDMDFTEPGISVVSSRSEQSEKPGTRTTGNEGRRRGGRHYSKSRRYSENSTVYNGQWLGLDYYPLRNTSPKRGYRGRRGRATGSPSRMNSSQEDNHVVHLHINPGETVAFQIGNEVQMIQGPATVRMVSTNPSPPRPLPVSVPHGHVMEQVVDANGTLLHVILSSQQGCHHASPPLVPMVGGPPPNVYGTAPNPNASGFYPYHSYNAPPPPYAPPPGPATPTSHPPPPLPNAPPPHNSPYIKDERTQRQMSKLKKKIQHRKMTSSSHLTPNKEVKNGNESGDADTSEEQDLIETTEEERILTEVLSRMAMPTVEQIEARSALLQWSYPTGIRVRDSDENEDAEEEGEVSPVEDLGISHTDVQFEVFISERGREFRDIYYGNSLDCRLTDLQPATEYSIKLQATIEDFKGAETEAKTFRTLPCEPDAPPPPKFYQKTKNSIQLKWNSPCDNGSRITHYILEWDAGTSRTHSQFIEAYRGSNKQYKVTRLEPMSTYQFRVAAFNGIGKSPYSDIAVFSTGGVVPPPPLPPFLAEPGVTELCVGWQARAADDRFTLQMEVEDTGYGFKTVYTGDETKWTCTELSRNTLYKFRLRASNEEGESRWSEETAFRTNPDIPLPPCRPKVKGKVLTTSCRLTWERPRDDGGGDILAYILELENNDGNALYSGMETEHLIEGLSPGCTYNFRVSCQGTGGRSTLSEPCQVTTLPVIPCQCSPPQVVGKAKATCVQLKWGPPDYNGGSVVEQYEVDMTCPDNTTKQVFFGSETECVITSLLPGRPYLFQVRSHNRVGPGPWSDPVQVISGAGPPDKPKEPRVSARSAHSIAVSWDEPLNNGAAVTEYHLELAEIADSSTLNFFQVYLGSALSHEVKNLQPAIDYFLKVQAVNSAGSSPWSSLAQCRTHASSPGSVTGVRCVPQACSVSLSWTAPACHGSTITGYNIQLGDRTIQTTEPDTEYTIEDLEPETTFRIRVQAVNGIGVGSFSSVCKVRTLSLPPAPPRLECIAATHNSLKLKWGDGRTVDYTKFVLDMENPRNNTFSSVYSGPLLQHKVGRLTECSEYRFRIYAVNEAGQGPPSPMYTFNTCKAPPYPVKAPKVIEITENSCQVSWQESRPGEDQILYQVQLLRHKDQDSQMVYKGADLKYQLSCLSSHSEYSIRVCPVRMCDPPIPGPYSPYTTFQTRARVPRDTGSTSNHHSKSQHPSSQVSVRKPLTDQQFAGLILLAVVFLGIFLAFVLISILDFKSSRHVTS